MRHLPSIWPVLLILALLFGYFLVVVPTNLTHAVLKSRILHAQSDVQQLTTSVTQLLADAQAQPRDLFLPDPFANVTEAVMRAERLQQIDAAAEVYTRAFCALLNHGSETIEILSRSADDISLASTLNPETVNKLGKQYKRPPNDPWNQPYRFYPAPWPERWGRLHDEPNSPVFIWSTGADRVSDRSPAAPSDDITNWERLEPWRAWYDRLSLRDMIAAAFF